MLGFKILLVLPSGYVLESTLFLSPGDIGTNWFRVRNELGRAEYCYAYI